ncbi:Sensor protein FixL [Caulifigura coniformis]|uniref:histidine kinase n=1 Tax=Caulifigura coniformis TaxID=2527983 RepID=A0A517SJ53_9PLAN|nr:ATP-binding protein [Caulifigura coniformis]QDT56160.1 Sensor protein FixL [Caulifigura coniformis]
MPHRPELLIRRLGRRYGIALAVVAGLLLLDQAVLQPLLVRLNLSAPVINLAGRQRMLSQSIAKDALAIAIDPQAHPSADLALQDKLAEWRRVHEGLKQGDASLKLSETRNPEIMSHLTGLDRQVSSIATAVNELRERPYQRHRSIASLLAAEREFLPAMDHIVQLYEEDAQQQVVRLRATGLVATMLVITLMAGLYWLVLGPAVTLIRQQVERLETHELELMEARDQLEQRVQERTLQLSDLNVALAEEASQRAASEQRTLQLQSQLAHASRLNSLGELATGIAHELNQPLGAISNYAETLLILTDGDLVDRQPLVRNASRIRESAQRAGAIIRRMRNFVRSRTTPRAIESVNSLITDVVALCEPDLQSRSVTVRVECDETTHSQVFVDAIQIQQVLVNVIRNAAQAVECRPRGRRVVSISTTWSSEDIDIRVDDNGEGFPDEFDVAGASLQSTKPDGLGLGLSISRSILATHGGELQTANHEEGGARVTVRLPLVETTSRLEPADRLCC